MSEVDRTMLAYIMQANRKRGLKKFYLFLDFDGVINVFYLPGTPAYEERKKQTEENFEFADHAAIERLARLCRDYPVEVIISSSWRFGGLKSCRRYLQKAGLGEDTPITGITQTDTFQSREKDIESYLLAHPDFTGFLIFDDMDMPDLKAFLVRTDPTKGWDEERDAYARNLLKKF